MSLDPLNALGVYIRPKIITQQPWTYIYVLAKACYSFYLDVCEFLLWSLKKVVFFSFFLHANDWENENKLW